MKLRKHFFNHCSLEIAMIVFFAISFTGTLTAKTLSIGTDQWVENLNPFSFKTYPAQLIVEFTTNKLLELKYTGNTGRYYEPDCQSTQNASIYNAYASGQSIFSVDLNSDCGLNLNDLIFTIKQINKVPSNIYFSHGLDPLSGGNKILIKRPYSAAFNKAALALTFPIIKYALSDNNKVFDHENKISSISSDDMDYYNSNTTGQFQLASLSDNRIELKRRNKTNSFNIHFKIHDLTTEFLKELDSNYHHIGLSLTGDLLKKFETKPNYLLVETDDLNSSTFFGFNYNANDSVKRKLIENVNFRHAFAFAVASTSVVKNRITSYGETMNHTFDTMRAKEDDIPNKYDVGDTCRQRVKLFTRTLSNQNPIEFVILIQYNAIFTHEQFEKIKSKLNKAFNPKISFRCVKPATNKLFVDDKKDGNFDIIFDTLFYGKNKLRYTEFLNPKNTKMNYLKCNVFSEKDIKKYQTDSLALDTFLWRVNKEVPVYIVGTFYHKNLFSAQIRKAHVPDNVKPEPFYHIHEWRFNN